MFYVFKRILAVIPVLGIVAVIVFLLLHLSPGDPAALIAGDTASSADVERVRQLLGLNRPLSSSSSRGCGGCCRATWACRCSRACRSRR